MKPEGRNLDVAFVGDPHGDYSPVRRLLSAVAPSSVVFLGDMDLEQPFEKEVKPLLDAGADVWYIHGNHDTDRENWYENLFESELGPKNLSGRVVEIDGVRVAGLGGVFRQKVWHPKNGDGKPVYRTRAEYFRGYKAAKWKGGLPLVHRSTIFPEDIEKLADLRADVLVSHEAPSCHRYGFEEIDLVAEVMGVHTIVHGHHHDSCVGTLPSGVRVIGLNKAEILRVDAGTLKEAVWTALPEDGNRSTA